MGQLMSACRGAVMMTAATALGACMMQGGGTDETVSRLGMAEDGTTAAATGARDGLTATSPIIDALQARRSVLPEGGAFDQVADAVLAANSRTAESELRAARLRADAASKNWLPKIGPSISLASLSEVVANIIVEQVLFDHGRLKAERAFAKADVEVAAVGLAEDTNTRVLTALTLYLDAMEGRERATLDARTLKDMGHFEWVMAERVRGGVSDRSDLAVLRQKLGEIKSGQQASIEAAEAALAELSAMSAVPITGLSGLSDVSVPGGSRPLTVLRAMAEKDRSVAQAKVDRAGLLPGLTAGGTVGDTTDGSIDVGGGLVGLGTGASLKAIEAERDAAARRVSQAQEDANRALRRLEQQEGAIARQVTEAATLTAQARANLDLFQEQYDSGQRQVTDVVGVYETFANRESAAVGLKYDLARTRLKRAALLGLLADGSAI